MPLQELNLGRALDVQTPVATIASLSRQRDLQSQEMQQNALQLQRLAQQIAESKKRADDETAIKGIIQAGGSPEEVSQKLLKAGYPDQSRAYLTNSQADILQQQQQALLKIQTETGKETAPQQIGEPGTQTPPSAIPEGGTVAPIQSPIPAGYTGAERNLPVTVPFIGQEPAHITPQNAREVSLAKRAEEDFKARLATREAVAKAQAERAGKADVKLDETYQDKPDGRHRMIRMQRPDNSQYVIDGGIVVAAPQNPPQPQAARSPERMKQDEDLADKRQAGNKGTADSTSYKFHVTELDKRAKPLDDSAARLSRLSDTLDQGTAQADALIAPELMTVMAGGLGSGVRITNSEIERVSGGRPMIALVQSKLRHWLSTDQKSAIDFAPQERQAMHDLVNIVGAKLTAKQQALTQAGTIISAEGTTDQQRRTALAELDKALRGIDGGSATPAVPTPSKAIVQQNKTTGAYRYSMDGGKTWQSGQPPQ